MGKIRVKTLGLDDLEKEQKRKDKKRRDAKKQKKEEKIVVEESLGQQVSKSASQQISKPANQQAIKSDKPETSDMIESSDKSDTSDKPNKTEKKEKSTEEAQKTRSSKAVGKKYKTAQKQVDKDKTYSLGEALKLMKKMAYAGFDETVEIHFNLREKGIRGEAQLPHGTGKTINIAIADDALLKKIDSGIVDFDVLIASPAFMPKLVKYAKVLGPKGLMPNPKTGTISDKPEEAAKKFQGGTVRFKGESKFPLLHQAVGKISFEDKKLSENIKALVEAVNKKNIVDIFIASTMSPSVKIDLETL